MKMSKKANLDILWRCPQKSMNVLLDGKFFRNRGARTFFAFTYGEKRIPCLASKRYRAGKLSKVHYY